MSKLKKYVTIIVIALSIISIFVSCGRTTTESAANDKEKVVAIETPKPLIKEEMSDTEFVLWIVTMAEGVVILLLVMFLIDEIYANKIEKRAWENKLKRYEELLKKYSKK